MKKIICSIILSLFIFSNLNAYNSDISDREYNLINKFVKNLKKSDAEKISKKIEKIEANYESWTKEKILLDRINDVIKVELWIKNPFPKWYIDYAKCNISWKILDIHRKEWHHTMLTHLKIKTEKWNYNVKVTEWYYIGKIWYWVLWVEIFTPKLLEWWWVEHLKKNQDVSFVVDEDTDRLLREWNEDYLDNCDISSQKLWDFNFEWWLTNEELIDLNMKKYEEMRIK